MTVLTWVLSDSMMVEMLDVNSVAYSAYKTVEPLADKLVVSVAGTLDSLTVVTTVD